MGLGDGFGEGLTLEGTTGGAKVSSNIAREDA